MDAKNVIHAKPCARCVRDLGRLQPLEPVQLDCPECQILLTQGLRIIATHPEMAFAIIGATTEAANAGRIVTAAEFSELASRLEGKK